MRAALIVVTGWLLLTLQTSTLHVLPGVPDFVVPFALYLGFTREVLRAALLAGALGYLADLLGGGPRGLHTFVAMVLSMSSSILSTRLFLRGAVFATVLTALGSVVSQLLTIGLLSALYRGFTRADLLWSDALPVGIATLVVGAPVFWLCARVDAIRRKPQREDSAMER